MQRGFVAVGFVLLAVIAFPLSRADGHSAKSKCPKPNAAFKVLWVYSGAIASCTKPIRQGGSLRPTETVSVTNSNGELNFQTPHLTRCIELGGSSDRLSPAKHVALRHLAGSTACFRPPGDTWTIKIGIHTVTGGDELLLRAHQGYFKVSVSEGTAHVDGLPVPPNHYWESANHYSKYPSVDPVGVFTPTTAQLQVLNELSSNTFRANASQLAPYFTQIQQPSVLLVGLDKGLLNQEKARLSGSGAEILALQSVDPNTIAVAYKQLRIKHPGPCPKIVGAGDFGDNSLFNALTTVLCRETNGSQPPPLSQPSLFWVQASAP